MDFGWRRVWIWFKFFVLVVAVVNAAATRYIQNTYSPNQQEQYDTFDDYDVLQSSAPYSAHVIYLQQSASNV